MTQNNEASKETRQPDSTKHKDKREKNFQSKIIIRRLPATMTEEQFLEQISPVPDNDYIHFVKADLSLGVHAYSRAYINVLNPDDILLMKDKFDGYVFVDSKGMEYPAIVEFAPFQKIPKKRSKKKDTKCGTIEQDPDYLKFLDALKNPPEEVPIPDISQEQVDESKGLNRTTPLIEYLKQKKLEKQKLRDEKREERKKRDLERKRLREEERRRRKSEKVQETCADNTSNSINNQQSASSEQQPVEVLKKPELENDHQKSNVSGVGSSSSSKVYKERESSGHHQNQHHHHHMTGAKDYNSSSRPYREKGHNTGTGNKRDWERDRQRDKMAAQRERERARKEENKVTGKIDKKSPLEQVKGFAATSSSSSKDVGKGSANSKSLIGSVFAEDPAVVAAALETTKHIKEPKKERQRIRNKDRPSIEIYRPGMRRLSGAPGGSTRSSPQKEGSLSPCTSPPLNKNSSSNNNNNSEEERIE